MGIGGIRGNSGFLGGVGIVRGHWEPLGASKAIRGV